MEPAAKGKKVKLTKAELNLLSSQSSRSFLLEMYKKNKGQYFGFWPVNRTWKEILKKEKTEKFYLHWCKSMVDAKTLVEAYKIRYYDILIDEAGDDIEYVIWCKKNLYEDSAPCKTKK